VVKDELEKSNLVFLGVFEETFMGSKHIFNFVELGKSAVLKVTKLIEHQAVMLRVLIDEFNRAFQSVHLVCLFEYVVLELQLVKCWVFRELIRFFPSGNVSSVLSNSVCTLLHLLFVCNWWRIDSLPLIIIEFACSLHLGVMCCLY